MSDFPVINISITNSKLYQPEFLQGLETWLCLGLLDDRQVKQICQKHLSCPLPLPQVVLTVPPLNLALDIEPSPPPRRRLTAVSAWMSEVSVLWFLFLGVFLVVVSSGVFAANQWQNSPPIGQYSILLAYTLAFSGASWWASRQPQLQLTTRMLQYATLLIVPVNFWMMDGLQLWQDSLGLGVMMGAALVLSGISFMLLKTLTRQQTWPLIVTNSWMLSWLHWGWSWAMMPLIAAYLGTWGTTLALFWCYRRRHISAPDTPVLAESDEQPAVATIMALALLILLVRAVVVQHLPLAQLGLAFGSCGWLLCWLNRRHALRLIWLPGVALMVLGWGVAVVQMPAQSIAVSLLGCTLLWERLAVQRQPGDLLALWLLGLQTYGLTRLVVPPALEAYGDQFLIQFFGQAGMPYAILGLGGLGYVVLTLLVAEWCWQQRELQLDRQAILLAGLLGSGLTVVSFANPGIRALNLFLSAILLWALTGRRPGTLSLIYLTQAIGLAAILAGIDVVYPHLSEVQWGGVLTGVALVEWLGSLVYGSRQWQRAAWHVGLAAAAFSYSLIFLSIPMWWLSVPVALMVLSRLRRWSGDGMLAARLSVMALVLQLPFSYHHLTISLVMAGVVMLVNTATLQSVGVAGLTVGLTLGAELMLVKDFAPQLLLLENTTAIAAVHVWLLWWVYRWLQRHNSATRELYVPAVNRWAIVIALATWIYLVDLCVERYWFAAAPPLAVLGGAGLLVLAILYRLRWQQTNLGWCGLAASVGTLVVLLVEYGGGRWPVLAATILALGLSSQLAGDGWVRRSSCNYAHSWHGIPLVYGVAGLVLGHSGFTATTGLYTLAAACVGLGVGRRQVIFKPIRWMAITLITSALYELVLFPMSQAQGGKAGDGLVILAGLTGLIAIMYHLLPQSWLHHWRITKTEQQAVCHLHWLWATVLGLTATLAPLSAIYLWLAVMAILAVYALAMGNWRWQSLKAEMPEQSGILGQAGQLETWTYLGIGLAIGSAGYGTYYLFPQNSLVATWGGSACVALAWRMYKVHWERLGWLLRPWQRAAMVLPLPIVVITAQSISELGLLIVAAFYAWLALARRQWRISYVAVALLDGVLLRSLAGFQIWSLLGWSLALGGTLLYIAQVEPLLQAMSARERRHWLRMIAAGQLALNAFYHAELSSAVGWAVLPLVIGLGLVLLGIRFQVRAFLYIGTLVFVLRVGRLLWLFTQQYWLAIWAVGIVLGLVMIWVAATFEARRYQVNALIQQCFVELDCWD